MFKIFKPNQKYSFNLQGEYLSVDKVPLETVGTNYRIEIHGEPKWFCSRWLGLISHYEVDLPSHQLVRINFVKVSSKVLSLHCEQLMVLTNI